MGYIIRIRIGILLAVITRPRQLRLWLKEKLVLSVQVTIFGTLCKRLLFFSYYEATPIENCNGIGVDVSGQDFQWNGMIYTPRSGVDFAGSGNYTYHGLVIAQFIDISRSDYQLQYDEDYLPQVDEDIIELTQ